MSEPKYRDGIHAQADWRVKQGAKAAAKHGADNIEWRDGRWRPKAAPLREVNPLYGPHPSTVPIDRSKQIRDALWYGLRPSWMYEREPHYDCGYLRHAAMNVALAWRWATGRETTEDIEFARDA